ncbi:DUF1190 domain-containing protein [Sulfitobacter sp. KE34]|uniref:DUF1190 domain-containing protein n=1 Tax=Sulfitobacter faviae TaxID=1775881 RepID=A0AAX3LV21_9RHOB|nr:MULTISPECIES: DUF1190 domain-containing protein [Sulfitobacter]MDF3351295.1 DUF1190 domain-containing protein [Sulfitobacter sp. KE12]MDF3354967.1 DUF1190 domain-containing protein [Sulfitobacter sp. KE27]MDF3358615.1 DUF1190 domain-containing protein [Sulfitobacter sp. KE33]MDF3362430.1 DUF1190 domain-containing protein [Sulfitobacter sp. Ks41]MDF3366039.1 DUF1190 domain-containing protein [Sulfitobacter sp. Ks34]
MTKRSKRVSIAIVGAAAFTLAGCEEEKVDAAAFPDLQSCLADAERGGMYSEQECETAFDAAQTLHVESAPRYDSLEVCEEQHGEGACGSEEAATQGGSGGIFMPLLAGYLIGNMMSNRAGMAAAQPLYKTKDGRFTNAARSSTYSTNRGAAKLSTSQFTRPSTTIGKTPMTRATAASRGGFGRAGGSRGFGG